jgi:hypothetical protein
MSPDGRVTCDDAASCAPVAGPSALDAAFARVLIEAGIETRVLFAPRERVGAVAVPSPAALSPHMPLAGRLERTAPGPDLAALLTAIDVSSLDDYTVVEVADAWRRQEAWAQAGQNAAIAEMLARGVGGRVVEDTSLIVGARLTLTRYQADRRVGIAAAANDLPALRDAWAAGVIDRDKTDALACTGTMPTAVRRKVIADLLEPDEAGGSRAERCTAPTPRELVRRAEHEADPEGAAQRHERARRGRDVTVQATDDAMAYLTAYLPVDQAARAWAAIEEAAQAMRSVPGETRTLGELRADALEALLDGRLELPHRAAADERRADGRPPAATRSRRNRTTVNVTVAASTLAGQDDAPGHLDRLGPIPAALARKLAAADSTWRRLVTDPVTGVLTDCSTRAYAPGVVLSRGVRLRDPVCTFPGCNQPAWRCELDHIEPHAGGRRSGSPATQPATGQTVAANLHPLCKHHHEAKTRGLWQVRRDPGTGRTTWRAPTGHEFVVDPHVADPSLSGRRGGRGFDAAYDPPDARERQTDAGYDPPDRGEPTF